MKYQVTMSYICENLKCFGPIKLLLPELVTKFARHCKQWKETNFDGFFYLKQSFIDISKGYQDKLQNIILFLFPTPFKSWINCCWQLWPSFVKMTNWKFDLTQGTTNVRSPPLLTSRELFSLLCKVMCRRSYCTVYTLTVQCTPVLYSNVPTLSSHHTTLSQTPWPGCSGARRCSSTPGAGWSTSPAWWRPWSRPGWWSGTTTTPRWDSVMVHYHNPELSIIVLLTSFISFRYPSSLGNGVSLLLDGCCYHYFILQLLNFLRGMCLSPNVPNVSDSLTCNLWSLSSHVLGLTNISGTVTSYNCYYLTYELLCRSRWPPTSPGWAWWWTRRTRWPGCRCCWPRCGRRTGESTSVAQTTRPPPAWGSTWSKVNNNLLWKVNNKLSPGPDTVSGLGVKLMDFPGEIIHRGQHFSFERNP